MYADPEASLTRNKSMKREPENASIWKRQLTGSSATQDCTCEGILPHARRARRREQNLWQQMRALIASEVESKVRASFG
ncbi:hypothetical protein [Burkholderia ambifaria]|uniref:hypothetical protein n=1 Tax=Burkholderia ambifaria TaxID=152480 RepID=UPI00158AE551|nr:hypothetical protein [Burkholderia ambifaria]